MLLTEPSKKLFKNLKDEVENLVTEKWSTWDEQERCEKIQRIKDMAGGVRTSLLKDVGTRAELKNLPFYDEIFIQDPKVAENKKYLEITFYFYGNQTISIKEKEIFLHIINLDKNHTMNVQKYDFDKLEPGRDYFCDRNMIPSESDNYSARIVVRIAGGMLMSEKAFKIDTDKEGNPFVSKKNSNLCNDSSDTGI